MKSFLLLAVVFMFGFFGPAFGEAPEGDVSGVVVDALSGERLVGAVVRVRGENGIHGLADADGRFRLSGVRSGMVLLCEFMGYEPMEVTYRHRSGEVRFRMKEVSRELTALEVTGRHSAKQVSLVQAGVSNMEMSDVKRMPVLFGERDVIKSLQLLPGVRSEGDGSSNFMVRGGTSSQNLILLDDAPVNTSGHLLGFFSAFNADVLRDVTLYKGQMPAQYGGRCSSVLDIYTKEGDMERYHGEGSVGLISAKVEADGPIVKDRASFVVAARRTYADVFLGLSDKYGGTRLYFYDVNGKVSWNVGRKDKLTASFFGGKDVFGVNDVMTVDWWNMNGSLKWNHRFKRDLMSNLTCVFSNYNSKGSMEIMDIDQEYGVGVMQCGVKEEVVWSPAVRFKPTVRVGAQSSYHDVKSGEVKVNEMMEKEVRDAWENACWVNGEGEMGRLSATAGVRLSGFSVLGGGDYYGIDSLDDIVWTRRYGSGEVVKTYWSVEPRLSLNYHLTENRSVKAAYSRVAQNVHSLVSGPSSSMFDRYTISTNNIRPEVADQWSVGYFENLRDNVYELSAEVYYKNVKDVLNYRDGLNYMSHIEIERLLLSGKGRAYGLELCAKKNEGRFTGWVSYTLSRSENKIEGINGGKWFVANNDKTHSVSAVGMYDLTKRWSVAATWVYSTGQPYTLPCGRYYVDGETVYLYDGRNNARTMAYHRLDVSATYRLKRHGRFEHELTLGVYNVYNRYNPYMIILEDDGTAKQYSMFGIIPSVSYNFKF